MNLQANLEISANLVIEFHHLAKQEVYQAESQVAIEKITEEHSVKHKQEGL